MYNTSSVHCIVCLPSQVMSSSITIYPRFHQHLWLPPPPPFPLVVTILLWLYNSFCLFVSLILIQHPLTSSTPTASILSSTSVRLFIFYLLHYFIHWIPHISEILWYLFFSDWFISLEDMQWAKNSLVNKWCWKSCRDMQKWN